MLDTHVVAINRFETLSLVTSWLTFFMGQFLFSGVGVPEMVVSVVIVGSNVCFLVKT